MSTTVQHAGSSNGGPGPHGRDASAGRVDGPPRSTQTEGRSGDRTTSRFLVLTLFLLSGASGLIYEVVWSRMFVLSLGCTVHAAAIVLGVFMGGLALGSWMFGRIADRPGADGLRIYGFLELGVGVCALALPALILLSDRIYCAAWPFISESTVGLMGIRVVLAALILLVPATLMGGTLPALSCFLVRRRGVSGREVGMLYAVNTLGAVIGCFVAGFFLLELLGARLTLYTAALISFVIAVVAIGRRRRPPPAPPGPEVVARPRPARRPDRSQVRLVIGCYAVSGFAALALEVIWTRCLLYFASADTYAFTAMLSAFLCGLGLGSLLMSRVTGRLRNPLIALGVVELLIGFSAAASIPLFERLDGAIDWVAGALSHEPTLLFKIATKLSCSFAIMFVPTVLMGAAFPLAATVYAGARRRVGRRIGTLYAANTVGAIGGSLAAGFLLIPALGLERGILLCASIFAALGLVLCAAGLQRPSVRRVALNAATLGVVGLVAANLLFRGDAIILHSDFFNRPDQPHQLLFFDEGSAASLAVLENKAGTRILNINGINTAVANHMDMQVHRMLSHLPMLLHPAPRNVLVVGFGMGSTPWGCCQHDVERVDVVELLKSERRTAALFEDVNHGVLAHPSLRFIEGDGRNHLLATRRNYDVISFNAVHPRYSAYLYTVDFYRLCRRKLTDEGVVCAWMTQNSMRDHEFRMLLRSFVEVFPNSSLWYCNPQHFCLIGTMGPERIDLDAWRRRMSAPSIREDLAHSQLDDPAVLASRYLIGGPRLARYVAGAPLNTDDRPLIEFTRSSKVDEKSIIDRLIALRANSTPPVHVSSDVDRTRSRFDACWRSATWLMRGQVEHWYPGTARSLRAEIAFRKALLACPDNQDVRHNLTFSESVKREVARQLADRPGHVGALVRLGAIAMEEGRLDDAEAHLVRALGIDRRYLPAGEYLGLVRLLQGEWAESAAVLRAVAAVRPDDARMKYALAVALERLGERRESVALRDAALSANPDVAEWFDMLERTVQLMRRQGGES